MDYLDKFHNAATNGYLDIVGQATRRELNQVDEDGVTPTHCAAAAGRLDVLRTIIGRGGNPDKSDYLGRTSLHHAVMKGHIESVIFLVNWGCNIWALDNSHHDAFDVSSMNNNKEIIKFLDQQRNTQLQKNKKTVDKMKERAVIEYDKNVKRYAKLQFEAKKKAEKENQRLEASRQYDGQVTQLGKMTIKQKLKTLAFRPKASRPFLHNTTPRGNAPTFGGAATSMKDGKTTVVSRGPNIMYVNTNGGQPLFPPDTDRQEDDDDDDESRAGGGLFRRRGLGNIAFLGNMNAAARRSMMVADAEEDDGVVDGTTRSGLSRRDDGLAAAGATSSTAGAGAAATTPRRRHGNMNLSQSQMVSSEHLSADLNKQLVVMAALGNDPGRLPWNDEVLGRLHEGSPHGVEDEGDEDILTKYSSLELFLVTFNLENYLHVFSREQIDLEALMLLEEADLMALSVQMGPRRKLMNAIERRRRVLSSPGPMVDSPL